MKFFEVTDKIPLFVSFNSKEDLSDESLMVKNELMFEFKDECIDLGRLIGYLQELPKKEAAKKLKELGRLYPALLPETYR